MTPPFHSHPIPSSFIPKPQQYSSNLAAGGEHETVAADDFLGSTQRFSSVFFRNQLMPGWPQCFQKSLGRLHNLTSSNPTPRVLFVILYEEKPEGLVFFSWTKETQAIAALSNPSDIPSPSNQMLSGFSNQTIFSHASGSVSVQEDADRFYQ